MSFLFVVDVAFGFPAFTPEVMVGGDWRIRIVALQILIVSPSFLPSLKGPLVGSVAFRAHKSPFCFWTVT